MVDDFRIGSHSVSPGDRRVVHLSAARLYDFTEMSIPVCVIHGKKPGPVLFVSGAIHGDEINGVEIVRRLLKLKVLNQLHGTLIAIPIVNVFGYNSRSRYLPDRRDLNRCFPGSANGSLGSRLAHIFMEEIVLKSTHGIDLHTGAIHRKNLAQVRAVMEHPENKKLAPLFGAPVVLNSELRDGSLRQAAQDIGIPVLLYEAGEALRFEEKAIQMGVTGILQVMKEIGLIEALPKGSKSKNKVGQIAKSSYWIRAPQSGTLIKRRKLGSRVGKGELLGYITDPFGHHRVEIEAQHPGLIIGATTLPLINRGDAIFHQAVFEDLDLATEMVELFNEDFIDMERTPY
ncbi:MAG: succinylglutamate desuccinylase/aspartoacylase family protein [Bdellovibrionales bacterium]|nr:succinylglutamate desuccinylase/aspartoacylase family protein [Bdellovibrionales bacterium]